MTKQQTENYITLLNEANKNLGLINEEITIETIDALKSLTDGQLTALFNQLYLVAEQRGHENFFTAEQNSFRDFIIDISSEFGWNIEDYMLEVLEGITPQWQVGAYTDVQQAENLVKDYEQKIKGTMHSERFSKQFPTTIKDYEYRKSLYPSKLVPFMERKVGMLTTSAEIYLQNEVLIDEIKAMCLSGDIVLDNGNTLNTSDGILTMLEKVRTAYGGFRQPNNIYNKDGVISITPYEDLEYIITKESYYNRMRVREYSGAFNLDEMRLQGRIIFVPESYDLGKASNNEDILMIVLDRRAIVIAIKLWRMSNFYVSNQYKTNHWLGVEGIRGHNTFINAVAFTGDAFGNFT